jgi:N-acetylglucosaminyldiphosphoundecaprenol N-acetyl-beta-D-mannosaminyltransferase
MTFSIIGTRVDPTSYDALTRQVIRWSRRNQSHYICLANVHVLMEAHDSSDIREAVNLADRVTPDGMPLVWLLRLKGQRGQSRVYGPELMKRILGGAAQEGIGVGFYGSAPDTLELLKKEMININPGLNVVYAYSPPFRNLTKEEDEKICADIRRSGVRILFIGLGCPKQERWMYEHRHRIQSVMLGVGAAFDFLAGVKRQSPPWMQRLGLEWMYRLIHEPRRLAKRYVRHNPRFLALAFLELIGVWRP